MSTLAEVVPVPDPESVRRLLALLSPSTEDVAA